MELAALFNVGVSTTIVVGSPLFAGESVTVVGTVPG